MLECLKIISVYTGHLSVMQQLLKANKKGAVMEDASGE